jgi:hypothetical protein
LPNSTNETARANKRGEEQSSSEKTTARARIFGNGRLDHCLFSISNSDIESGEDYLYPANFFVEVEIPKEAEQALLRAS